MQMAGLGPADIDVVELYDAFTINPILFLEDLGFCPKGEGGRFVGGGRIAPGGGLPVNTNGGGLSYCHPGMYGLFLLIEAVRQLRGECGARQVTDCTTALAHGNGGVLSSQSDGDPRHRRDGVTGHLMGRPPRRIGIDVGGTNTDAVLLEGGRVVQAVKTPTTADVTGGIVAALAALMRHPEVAPGAIDGVVIGTTHFINAVVQRHGLTRVAAVRIGLPASASLPPFCDWPADLAAIVRGEVFMLEGGHEYDGRPLVPFDEDGMRRAARQIREARPRRRRGRRGLLAARPVATRSGRAKSSPRNAPGRPSPCRTTSAASASWSARTPPSSTPRSPIWRGSRSPGFAPPSRRAASPRRST